MQLKSITDASFRPYGKVITNVDASRLVEAMKHTPLPTDETIYVASDELLESLPEGQAFQRIAFGELPIQIGYCNGYNTKLNALEYHRCSEVNIAVNDLVILIGKQQDVTEDFHYDTSLVEAFLVPGGTAFEMYGTTLHYAPCSYKGQPFQNVVILPKGTNEALATEHKTGGEDRLLTAVNKWLIAHEEAGIEGAFNGLVGENLEV